MDKKAKDVAYFMARLYQKGLTTSLGGNISVKGDGNFYYITPSSLDKATLDEKVIAKVDLASNNLTPHLKLSIENEMHRQIYLTRGDVKAIIHAHPVFATTFSATSKEINTKLTGESVAMIKNYSLVSYHKMGSDALAKAVADGLKNSDVALMENHGVVAVGSSLLEAFERIEVFENCAKMTYISENLDPDGIKVIV